MYIYIYIYHIYIILYYILYIDISYYMMLYLLIYIYMYNMIIHPDNPHLPPPMKTSPLVLPRPRHAAFLAELHRGAAARAASGAAAAGPRSCRSLRAGAAAAPGTDHGAAGAAGHGKGWEKMGVSARKTNGKTNGKVYEVGVLRSF